MRDAGYVTAAVDSLGRVKPWFSRGYQYYIDPPEFQHSNGAEVNAHAIEWLRGHAGKQPFFLFLHYWDTHTPYLPPERYRTMFYEGDPFDPGHDTMATLRNEAAWPFFKRWHYDLLTDDPENRPVMDVGYITALYDAEVRYLDDLMSDLMSCLHDLGLADDTVVLFTADHGESLTEHGLYFDHPGLYEQTIRVPLIVWGKNLGVSGRVPGLATHLDLLPTLLTMAGRVPLPGLEGLDLMAAAKAGQVERREIACCECTWRAAWAWRNERYKLIKTIDPGPYTDHGIELYDLKADPQELNNLALEQPERAAQYELELVHWQEARLGCRPDPVRVWASQGLPGTGWLERTLREMGIDYTEWMKRQKYT
jgi:arylsulfatase